MKGTDKMDISTLTKEELETLQSQITTQLSTVEREEIEHQTPEEQLNSLVEYFNKETSSKQVPFTMSLKNTRNAGYVLELIDTRDNYVYDRVREQRASLDFLIEQTKRHIKCIPVYDAFVKLDVDDFEYVRFDQYCIKFKYSYINVDYELDYSGRQCELTASLRIHHRAEACHLSVRGLGLIVRTENDGIVDITLRNYDVCDANELAQTTEELKCEIYDTDEALEGTY